MDGQLAMPGFLIVQDMLLLLALPSRACSQSWPSTLLKLLKHSQQQPDYEGDRSVYVCLHQQLKCRVGGSDLIQLRLHTGSELIQIFSRLSWPNCTMTICTPVSLHCTGNSPDHTDHDLQTSHQTPSRHCRWLKCAYLMSQIC